MWIGGGAEERQGKRSDGDGGRHGTVVSVSRMAPIPIENYGAQRQVEERSEQENELGEGHREKKEYRCKSIL